MTGKNNDEEKQLLRDYDEVAKRVKRELVSRLGEKAESVLHESREEYRKIIPHIPSAGGREPFTRFLTSTGQYLALYRVLKTHGFTSKEAGGLLYSLTSRLLESYPGFLVRFLAPNIFSKDYIEKVRIRAGESQRRSFGGYVFNYVEGTPDFDYGVDYTECGVHRFLLEMGAPELTPYVCAMDVLSSDRLGWGLRRTMTIAGGGHVCDFRFRKDGVTDVSSSVIERE